MNSISTIFGLLLDAFQLGPATLAVSPNTYLTEQSAYEQAFAALAAATPELPADILLGMAWVESRYSPDAVSRVEGNARRTGIPLWKSPPKGTRSFFCGVTQVSAEDSWDRCRKFHDVFEAYRTAVVELKRWLSPRICNHDLICALTGYNGGFPAIKVGTRYATIVMWRAQLIRRALRRKVS